MNLFSSLDGAREQGDFYINTRYSCHEMCKNEFRMVPARELVGKGGWQEREVGKF